MQRIYFYAVFLALILSSCQLFKEEEPAPELPPITQEGLQTLGFKVDGQIWVPNYEEGIFDPSEELNIQYYEDENSPVFQRFSISGLQGNRSSRSSFGIAIFQLNGEGEAFHKDSIDIAFNKGTGSFLDDYSLIFENSRANIRISRLDTVENIIAGEFDAVLVNAEGREIQITEGRFDVRYE